MEDFVFQVLGVNKFTQEILHLKKENLLLKKIHHFISNLKPNNKPKVSTYWSPDFLASPPTVVPFQVQHKLNYFLIC
jgi:hypothetical protein